MYLFIIHNCSDTVYMLFSSSFSVCLGLDSPQLWSLDCFISSPCSIKHFHSPLTRDPILQCSHNHPSFFLTFLSLLLRSLFVCSVADECVSLCCDSDWIQDGCPPRVNSHGATRVQSLAWLEGRVWCVTSAAVSLAANQLRSTSHNA